MTFLHLDSSSSFVFWPKPGGRRDSVFSPKPAGRPAGLRLRLRLRLLLRLRLRLLRLRLRLLLLPGMRVAGRRPKSCT